MPTTLPLSSLRKEFPRFLDLEEAPGSIGEWFLGGVFDGLPEDGAEAETLREAIVARLSEDFTVCGSTILWQGTVGHLRVQVRELVSTPSLG